MLDYRVFTAALMTGLMAFAVRASPATKPAKLRTALAIANSFLGIAYRDDGAINALGRYTTFADPQKIFSEPGLNCSGFLLAAVREIYQKPITLAKAERDRKQDSGPNSPLGHDWDYGLDFILNLAEITSRKPRLILPGRGHRSTTRGFNLHKKGLWPQVLRQIRPGYLYLLAINKDTRRAGYRHVYYHVGLIIPEGKARAWFYHATKKSSVHRMDLKSSAGLDRFLYQFAKSAVGPKYLYLLEIKGPKREG